MDCDWPEFTFNSEGRLDLCLADLPSDAEWMVDVKKAVVNTHG